MTKTKTLFQTRRTDTAVTPNIGEPMQWANIGIDPDTPMHDKLPTRKEKREKERNARQCSPLLKIAKEWGILTVLPFTAEKAIETVSGRIIETHRLTPPELKEILLAHRQARLGKLTEETMTVLAEMPPHVKRITGEAWKALTPEQQEEHRIAKARRAAYVNAVNTIGNSYSPLAEHFYTADSPLAEGDGEPVKTGIELTDSEKRIVEIITEKIRYPRYLANKIARDTLDKQVVAILQGMEEEQIEQLKDDLLLNAKTATGACIIALRILGVHAKSLIKTELGNQYESKPTVYHVRQEKHKRECPHVVGATKEERGFRYVYSPCPTLRYRFTDKWNPMRSIMHALIRKQWADQVRTIKWEKPESTATGEDSEHATFLDALETAWNSMGKEGETHDNPLEKYGYDSLAELINTACKPKNRVVPPKQFFESDSDYETRTWDSVQSTIDKRTGEEYTTTQYLTARQDVVLRLALILRLSNQDIADTLDTTEKKIRDIKYVSLAKLYHVATGQERKSAKQTGNRRYLSTPKKAGKVSTRRGKHGGTYATHNGKITIAYTTSAWYSPPYVKIDNPFSDLPHATTTIEATWKGKRAWSRTTGNGLHVESPMLGITPPKTPDYQITRLNAIIARLKGETETETWQSAIEKRIARLITESGQGQFGGMIPDSLQWTTPPDRPVIDNRFNAPHVFAYVEPEYHVHENGITKTGDYCDYFPIGTNMPNGTAEKLYPATPKGIAMRKWEKYQELTEAERQRQREQRLDSTPAWGRFYAQHENAPKYIGIVPCPKSMQGYNAYVHFSHMKGKEAFSESITILCNAKEKCGLFSDSPTWQSNTANVFFTYAIPLAIEHVLSECVKLSEKIEKAKAKRKTNRKVKPSKSQKRLDLLCGLIAMF